VFFLLLLQNFLGSSDWTCGVASDIDRVCIFDERQVGAFSFLRLSLSPLLDPRASLFWEFSFPYCFHPLSALFFIFLCFFFVFSLFFFRFHVGLGAQVRVSLDARGLARDDTLVVPAASAESIFLRIEEGSHVLGAKTLDGASVELLRQEPLADVDLFDIPPDAATMLLAQFAVKSAGLLVRRRRR
jgi:hypothetical protein